MKKITINQDELQLRNNELFFAFKSLIIRILDIHPIKLLEQLPYLFSVWKCYIIMILIKKYFSHKK